ncbi:hypothetical protein CDAR_43021 [Caerostris darwini]|uniref:Uncharacterized protein n=1 Tax=Caerostris darwini TaxID=1538125 RepID=A0AAV4WGD1_9ARAC|nr:hypothetical protein CDAR_43021 [Caerostris darwini]
MRRLVSRILSSPSKAPSLVKHDEFGFLVVLHHVIRFNFTTAVGESSKISWFGFIDYTISISKRTYKNSSGSDYKVVYYEDCEVVYYSAKLKVVYAQSVQSLEFMSWKYFISVSVVL